MPPVYLTTQGVFVFWDNVCVNVGADIICPAF